MLFLSRRFSRVSRPRPPSKRWPHDEDPSPRRRSRLGPCHRPTGACRLPGTPSTNRNTSKRRCLPGGRAPRCSPRPAVLPARCGSSLPPNTAGGSDAGCPSALVLPALCPARISVSSSLLAATMNQKSSLREVPQFVSGGLTADTPFSFVVPISLDRRQEPQLAFFQSPLARLQAPVVFVTKERQF